MVDCEECGRKRSRSWIKLRHYHKIWGTTLKCVCWDRRQPQYQPSGTCKHNSTSSQKSSSHLKILTKSSVTGKQFHTNDPQISGTTLQIIGHLNNLMPGIWEPWSQALLFAPPCSVTSSGNGVNLCSHVLCTTNKYHFPHNSLQKTQKCVISGFHSSVNEIFALLGLYAV
jgi:hypothetical protein